MLYKFFRPLIFIFTPELDHRLVGFFLSLVHRSLFLTYVVQYFFKNQTVNSNIKLGGLKFNNRVGMAAGFDKNGTFYNGIAALGAGFVEVGSVTLTSQAGNPKPRVKRLPEDEAIINHMGLNNVGAKQVKQNLQKRKPLVPIGINIAPNHGISTTKMIMQMAKTVEILSENGDFFILNLSCPNQEGVTSLQTPDNIQKLLKLIKVKKPIFLKFSSDLSDKELIECINSVFDQITGVILSNTTLTRTNLVSTEQNFVGGLSGKPLYYKVLNQVRLIRKQYQKKLIIIHSGGIFTPDDVEETIEAGADLVQVYTSLIYRGPAIFKELTKKDRQLGGLF